MDPRTTLQSGPAPCPPPSGIPAMPVAIIGTDGYQAASIPVALTDSAQLALLRDKFDQLGLILTDILIQAQARDALLTALVETTTVETPQALIVSTTAVPIVGANVARKSLLISNNGTGSLYLKGDKSVASSGISMGIVVPSNATYSDSGFGVYLGAMWGIYSAVSAVQNVVVSDRY